MSKESLWSLPGDAYDTLEMENGCGVGKRSGYLILVVFVWVCIVDILH